MPEIRTVVVSFLAIVISLTVHEFAHAFVADRLGDDTPRRHGRVTLNPIVLFKAYPFGSLLVPLIGAFTGFLAGWAMTPVNPARVRRDITVRTADILITAAGPISNVLLAILCLGLYGGVLAVGAGQDWAAPLLHLLTYLVLANVFIAVFNMMPIPPLDGFGILKALFPRASFMDAIQQYSLIILIVFIMYAGKLFGPLVTATFGVLNQVKFAVLGA